ncbi:cell wall hydrolase [Cuneatibacter caecimuris]|uniref:SH3 domain-containing protein n=1 Tax=Cuneatibacter caecimuris TaxID=1796618 RepID=A0A4V2F878_9FIRM|nr:cell wall hydrolase [Cuneatibacter caecimuris]RZT02467.1 SH3 domain-containing protein [Cuneatibacter caecimuris]
MKSKSKCIIGGAAAGLAMMAAVVGINVLPGGTGTSSDETVRQAFSSDSLRRLDDKLLAVQELELASKEEFQYFVSTTKIKGNSLADLTGSSEPEAKETETTAAEKETKETEGESSTSGKAAEEDTKKEDARSEKEKMFDQLALADPSKAEPYLNMRAVPDTSGEVLGRLYPGDGGTVLEQQGGWTRMKSGSVEGWVFSDCLLYGEDALKASEENNFGQMVAAVNSEASMNIRQKKSVTSTIIDMALPGQVYPVAEVTEDWIGIQYNENTIGYLSAPYVTVRFDLGYAESMEAIRKAEEAQRQKAAAEAARQEEAAKQQTQATAPPQTQPSTQTPSQPVINGNQQTALNYTQAAPVSLTPEQRTLMAAVVQTEAGSRACEGQLAVANVILNRLRSGIWGGTLEGVLYAPYQFTCVSNGAVAEALATGISAASYNAVDQACAGVNNIDDYMYFCSQRKAQPGLYVKYILVNGNCFYKKR